VQPCVARVAHDRQQQGTHIPTLVSVEKAKGAQKGLLRHILSVLFVSRQPVREVVRRVQMRQAGLLKAFASYGL